VLFSFPSFLSLVLKGFFVTDYRGIMILFEDLPELTRLLELRGVPHRTTLQKASVRLLRRPHVRRLLRWTIRRVLGHLRRHVRRAALDSTGLERGHTSYYYIRRRSKCALDKCLPGQSLCSNCSTRAIMS